MNTPVRIAAVLGGLAATLAIAIVTAGVGAYYYFRPGLPSAETLREVPLQTPLAIYSRDGRLIDQIGEKRRTPVEYEEIPEPVIQAFLAAEDDRFFDHPGFDYQGITRAAVNLLLTGNRSQGGSTITQQLARVYFLTRERTFVRKAKELILAVRIEQEFSKEKILSLYLNKIFLGQRAYGVVAAGEVYFGKALDELSIAEAATIAGLPKAPSTLNPVTSPERATDRRGYVLGRMRELGYITEADYTDAIATPMVSRLHGPRVALRARYVAEMVRAEMVSRFGLGAYTDGYKVITTVDSQLQEAAQEALITSLLEYDRRHGYRGPAARDVLADLARDADGQYSAVDLNTLLAPYPDYGGLYSAVVLDVGDDNSAQVFVRDRGLTRVAWEGLNWRRYINDNVISDAPDSARDVVQAGDVVYLASSQDGWLLAQPPAAQAAFVALDPADGATIALSGGFDFEASKFNRAVQTRRQPGSSFKPFIYSAALANGYTTASLINDAPVVFDDDKLEETWRPENYSRKFNGPTRLREALIRSLNLVSVRLLLGTGLGNVLEHLEDFGLPASALPRDSSLALGSGGAAPMDVAAGYAVFANGGFRVQPYLIDRIVDGEGRNVFIADPPRACSDCEPDPASEAIQQIIADRPLEPERSEELKIVTDDAAVVTVNEVPDYASVEQMSAHGMQWRATTEDAPDFVQRLVRPAQRVISAENAYLVYDMMRDVIRRGTGRRARELGRSDIAGKTGTSNDRRDAWFSGFNGSLVATAWVGFDQERSLGAGEEGGRTALPMWKYFMADALPGTSEALIPQPAGIVTARIDPESGLIAAAGSPGAIFEIFEAGQLPDAQQDTPVPALFGGDQGVGDEQSLF